MTWTRLDDGWTDRHDLADLAHETRWHLLALIGFCSRTHRYDGIVRVVDARRVSDVADPDTAAAELVAAGHLEAMPEGRYRLVHIDDHIPPPHLRDEHRKASSRARKQRERSRRTEAPPDPVTPDVDGDVTRDTGTGRDRTGQDHQTHHERDEATTSWPPVRPIPGHGRTAGHDREEWAG